MISTLSEALKAAMWAGDVDTLHRLAPCECCCWDHTRAGCDARDWGGCRGQTNTEKEDEESWVKHYATAHGMTRDQFFCYDEAPSSA